MKEDCIMKKNVILLLVTLTLSSTVPVLSETVNASSKPTTTYKSIPKTLRGTWYRPVKGGWGVMKIGKKHIKYYNINSRGKKVDFLESDSGDNAFGRYSVSDIEGSHEKIPYSRYKKASHKKHAVYQIGSAMQHGTMGAKPGEIIQWTDIPLFWRSTGKFHGKKYSLLRTSDYILGAKVNGKTLRINSYTRHKVKHHFTNVNKDYKAKNWLGK
jgi:hypothetical protein